MLKRPKQATSRITTLEFNEDDTLLFAGERSGRLQIRNVKDGRLLLHHKIHDRAVLWLRCFDEESLRGKLESQDRSTWKTWDISRLDELVDEASVGAD